MSKKRGSRGVVKSTDVPRAVTRVAKGDIIRQIICIICGHDSRHMHPSTLTEGAIVPHPSLRRGKVGWVCSNCIRWARGWRPRGWHGILGLRFANIVRETRGQTPFPFRVPVANEFYILRIGDAA